MKKFFAILLAAMMIFTVCACQKTPADDVQNSDDVQNVNTPDDDNTVNPDDDANTPDDTNTDADDDDTIIMATNAYFKPYEYYEGENIIGIDAEIAAACLTEYMQGF